MTSSNPITDGRIDIKQGPEWLVDLLLTPPWWLQTGISLVTLVAVALAVRGLYQRGWTLDDDTQEEMLANATVVVGVMTSSVLVGWYTTLPYVLDVTVGLTVGLGASIAVNHRVGSWLDSRSGDGRRKAYIAAWQGLTCFAVLPLLLAGEGALPFVFRGSVIMACAATVLAVYNAGELADG